MQANKHLCMPALGPLQSKRAGACASARGFVRSRVPLCLAGTAEFAPVGASSSIWSVYVNSSGWGRFRP